MNMMLSLDDQNGNMNTILGYLKGRLIILTLKTHSEQLLPDFGLQATFSTGEGLPSVGSAYRSAASPCP